MGQLFVGTRTQPLVPRRDAIPQTRFTNEKVAHQHLPKLEWRGKGGVRLTQTEWPENPTMTRRWEGATHSPLGRTASLQVG